jgi:hypothetical protein
MAGQKILMQTGAFSEPFELFVLYVDVPPAGAITDGKLASAEGWPGRAAVMRENLEVPGMEIGHD